MKKISLNLDDLNNYDINSFVIPNRCDNLNSDFFYNIPTLKKINKWIQIYVIDLSYVFVGIGIIALILLLTFISLYVLHNSSWEGILISGICIGIFFLIGYFSITFSYSFYIKNKFKSLKFKFKFLIKNNFINKNLSQYPTIIQMIEYDQEKTKWKERQEVIPNFSYYGCVAGLILFFEKLKLIQQNENNIKSK